MNKKNIVKIVEEAGLNLFEEKEMTTMLNNKKSNKKKSSLYIPENRTQPVNDFDFTQYLDFLRNRYPEIKRFKYVTRLYSPYEINKVFIAYMSQHPEHTKDVILDETHFIKSDKIRFDSFTIITKDFAYTYKDQYIGDKTFTLLFCNDPQKIKKQFFDEKLIKYDKGVYKVYKSHSGYYIKKVDIKCVEKPILNRDLFKYLNTDVMSFFKSKSFYKNNKLPYKRGLMLYGPWGCHSKGTKILMFDGTIKNVEDIVIGDKLMGPDNNPREVLKLVNGREQMVQIIPNKGEPFVVNINHILSLIPYGKSTSSHYILNLSMKNYIKQSRVFQDRFKLYRVPVRFNKKQLKIPPYILGIWLGDGHSSCSSITTADDIIKNEWFNYCQTLNMTVTTHKQRRNNKSSIYHGVYRKRHANPFMKLLQDYNLINNKHIPIDYLTSNTQQRLELLAGLLDTDGYARQIYTSRMKYGCGYEIIQKSYEIAQGIVFLCRSVGLGATIKKCNKACYKGGHKVMEGQYYRVNIYGKCNIIPVKLPRRQVKARKNNVDIHRTGFTYKILPEDDYYGFIIDRDHLYLTSDFIVHHNCGKTSFIKYVLSKCTDCYSMLIDSQDFSSEIHDFIDKVFPINGKKIIVFEDIDSLGDHRRSEFLNFIDGVKVVENTIFIATTNFPDLVDPALIDRPSRFDRIFKIDLPSKESRKKFLLKFFPNLNEKELEEYASLTKNFSGAYFTELFKEVNVQNVSIKDVIKRLSKQIRMCRSKNFDEKASIGFGQEEDEK